MRKKRILQCLIITALIIMGIALYMVVNSNKNEQLVIASYDDKYLLVEMRNKSANIVSYCVLKKESSTFAIAYTTPVFYSGQFKIEVNWIGDSYDFKVDSSDVEPHYYYYNNGEWEDHFKPDDLED